LSLSRRAARLLQLLQLKRRNRSRAVGHRSFSRRSTVAVLSFSTTSADNYSNEVVRNGFVVLVLAVVVGQRDRVLRGRGRGRPPATGAVDVLAGPTGPLLVPARPVLWPR